MNGALDTEEHAGLHLQRTYPQCTGTSDTQMLLSQTLCWAWLLRFSTTTKRLRREEGLWSAEQGSSTQQAGGGGGGGSHGVYSTPWWRSTSVEIRPHFLFSSAVAQSVSGRETVTHEVADRRYLLYYYEWFYKYKDMMVLLTSWFPTGVQLD